MKYFSRAALAAIVLSVAVSASSADAGNPVRVLSAAEKADIKRVEAYLDRLETLQATFLQVSSNGENADGKLYLLRPGHLKIEYAPPVPILIVADGSFLSYIDKELGQVTHIPVDDTPAGFLLRDKFSFTDGGVQVTDFIKEHGALSVSVVRADDPFAGELTLVFADSPLSCANGR